MAPVFTFLSTSGTIIVSRRCCTRLCWASVSLQSPFGTGVLKSCGTELTFSGASRMYRPPSCSRTTAGLGSIQFRTPWVQGMFSDWSLSQNSLPIPERGSMSFAKSCFISRSAWSRTRPASVFPNSLSMIRSGSSGLRLTQNFSGVSASQVKKLSEISPAFSWPP